MKTFIDRYLKYLILTIAITLLVIGVIKDDPSAVFRKAVAICMECIGIG